MGGGDLGDGFLGLLYLLGIHLLVADFLASIGVRAVFFIVFAIEGLKPSYVMHQRVRSKAVHKLAFFPTLRDFLVVFAHHKRRLIGRTRCFLFFYGIFDFLHRSWWVDLRGMDIITRYLGKLIVGVKTR